MLGRVLGMLNRTPSMSQQLDELTEFGPDEVAEHNSTSSCWLVIDNLVYDVTNFHHPGGNDRLFDLAGTDVTQNFMAIGHSMAAHRQLRRLLIGRLQSDAHEPPPAPRVPAGYADTIERRALRGGSTHRLPRPNEPLWSTRSRGFLPTRDPLKELPPAYSVLTELVACLPTALADGSFRRLVEADAARFEPLTNLIASEKSLDVLERVHALYGYIGKGYVHGHVDGDGAQHVPPFLSTGWLAVSSKIGRQPTIDYADCVLNNWERIVPNGPLTPENLRLLNRFTGLLDEEWFLKTHVIIESEAAGVVSAIYDAYHAIKLDDCDKLLAMLGWLEQAMSHVASNCLWIMFERTEEEGFLCEPDFSSIGSGRTYQRGPRCLKGSMRATRSFKASQRSSMCWSACRRLIPACQTSTRTRSISSKPSRRSSSGESSRVPLARCRRSCRYVTPFATFV